MGKGVGIDFGTTNTVVSYVEKGNLVRTFKVGNQLTIPTVVYFISKNEYIIGQDAKNKYNLNPNAGVSNFKTTIGDSTKFTLFAENGDKVNINSFQITKYFINRIINNIQDVLIKKFGAVDGLIDDVVITVPAKFNDTQKDMIKKSAKSAGFDSVKLVVEPTAAAVAFREENSVENKTILVYDMGGGTFDVSVIQEKNAQFNEIATGGDKTLGGNKFTTLIAEHICKLIEDDFGIILPFDSDDFDEDECEISELDYKRNIHEIINNANMVKEELTEEEVCEVFIHIILPNNKQEVFSYSMTREKFNEFILEYIKLSIKIVDNVINESKAKNVNQIDHVVLAGGSSQIVLISDLFQEHLKQNNVVYADDVSTLISRGAALLAKEELGDKIKPITSLQYGIGISNKNAHRKFSVVVPENQELPYTALMEFNLNKDGQQRVEVPYFERDIKTYPNAVRTDDDGISLIDTIIIENLPPNLKANNVSITIEFSMQIDGTFNLKILSIRNGTEKISLDNIVQTKKSTNL